MKFNHLLNQLKQLNVGQAMLFSVALAVFVQASVALAASSGQGLPWEGPLETLVNSLSGPVAFGISVVGIAGSLIALIFGGSEISGFIKVMVYIVLVISFLLAIPTVLTTLFGASAALPSELTQEQIMAIVMLL